MSSTYLAAAADVADVAAAAVKLEAETDPVVGEQRAAAAAVHSMFP